MRRPGEHAARLRIKEPFVTRTSKLAALRVPVHGAGEMRALSAVGHEAAIAEAQQDGVIVGPGILEVVYPAGRDRRCLHDRLKSAAAPSAHITKCGEHASAGEQRPRRPHRPPEELAARHQLVGIPLEGELDSPAVVARQIAEWLFMFRVAHRTHASALAPLVSAPAPTPDSASSAATSSRAVPSGNTW